MKNKIPDQCKSCAKFWPHGIKDGKHDRWCCELGKPAPKAINQCKLHNFYKPKESK